MTGTAGPIRVLVLCTGNSCRSIMAEALINHAGGGRHRAVSAGSHPTGSVHPLALETLKRHGVDPGQPTSKSWDQFATDPFDLVITVCDSAAGESCPVAAGGARRLHWSLPDPAAAKGSDAERREVFDQVFAELRRRVDQELLGVTA